MNPADSIKESGMEMVESASRSASEARNTALRAIDGGKSVIKENVVGTTHLKSELGKIAGIPGDAISSTKLNTQRLLNGDVIGIVKDFGEKIAKTMGTPTRLGIAGVADVGRAGWAVLKAPITLPLAAFETMKKGGNMMLNGYGKFEDILFTTKTEESVEAPAPVGPVGPAPEMTDAEPMPNREGGGSSNEFAEGAPEEQGEPTGMAA
ncbi:hypothetical protein KKA95_01890 [Patescibacteria group bacterium]|nr:hypothetical protein [Patescibacteria group bacterium]